MRMGNYILEERTHGSAIIRPELCERHIHSKYSNGALLVCYCLVLARHYKCHACADTANCVVRTRIEFNSRTRTKVLICEMIALTNASSAHSHGFSLMYCIY